MSMSSGARMDEHQLTFRIVVCALILLVSVIGACTVNAIHSRETYTKAGYCETTVVGRQYTVWTKCP